MTAERLSVLDTSFLDVEGPTAHMHVGWAATFSAPDDGAPPDFERLRDHIAGRLGRAPRYRQKLAPVPLDLDAPVWVDDDRFDADRHILHARGRTLDEVVDAAMSTPLERDRPLWELWIADRLEDGRVAVVGKAHHCMVDGLAAVEMAKLLLDLTPEPETDDPADWRPVPGPDALALVLRTAAEQAALAMRVAGFGLGLMRHPERALRAGLAAARAATAVSRALLPPAPPSPLNAPSSPLRHLACARRPLADLREVKEAFGGTVNDVLLAACAGALRRWYDEDRGEPPVDLRTMVPVSVRGGEETGRPGNRISFMFIDLPCTEPDPCARLELVHDDVALRREAGEPEGASAALELAALAPRPVRRALSQAVASPRAFNLVVSNIPGPRVPLWMCGLRLEAAYPVVPLAADHALSIGMTTVGDDACFGLYADRKALPDADRLAAHLGRELDELVELARAPRRRVSESRGDLQAVPS